MWGLSAIAQCLVPVLLTNETRNDNLLGLVVGRARLTSPARKVCENRTAKKVGAEGVLLTRYPRARRVGSRLIYVT